jgi:hypothetical protein
VTPISEQIPVTIRLPKSSSTSAFIDLQLIVRGLPSRTEGKYIFIDFQEKTDDLKQLIERKLKGMECILDRISHPEIQGKGSSVKTFKMEGKHGKKIVKEKYQKIRSKPSPC